MSNRASKEQVTTPTSSRKSVTSQPRPRTLPLDRSGGRVTPTDKSANKTQARTSGTKKDMPKAPVATHRTSDLKKTRLSAPMLTKVEIDIEPRRSSMGSSLSKSKSGSMHSLTFAEEELELTPRGTSRKPRSKWSKSNLASFASVPNLLQPDDDGRISFKSSGDDSSSVDTVKTDPDINDNVFKEPHPVRRSSNTGQKSETSPANSRRSASTSRLSSSSKEEDKKSRKTGPVSATNLRNVDGQKKSKDRDLMPPPVAPSFKSSRHDRIAKRANDARRKTTDNSGFSLEEAKEILSGKSVKITEIKENVRRKRSTSTSPNRAQVQSKANVDKQSKDKSDFLTITDPGVLDASKEIEMTAAELRRKSMPATNPVSMEASPNDPPERDVPSSVNDASKPRSRANRSAKVVNKTNVIPKSQAVNKGDSSDSQRDSGMSTQEDEDCPSPSVKERIARLNKQVTDSDRQASSSPSRDGSPFRDRETLRQMEPVQLSVSANSASVSVNSAITDSGISMSMSSVSENSSSRSSQSNQVSSSKYSSTFQSNINESNTDINQSKSENPMSSSAQSLSPPSGLGTSMDSDGLANNFSPGNNSNSSPRSVADTGLGSDTDLETR